MKAVYERPRVGIELFTPASTIADCTSEFDMTFDCFKGPTGDDVSKVVNKYLSSTPCTNEVGYASLSGGNFTLANDGNANVVYIDSGYNAEQHSTSSDMLEWASAGGQKGTITAKNPSSFLGWLYVCFNGMNGNYNSFTTTGWSLGEDGNLHYNGGSGVHGGIAAVYGSVAFS